MRVLVFYLLLFVVLYSNLFCRTIHENDKKNISSVYKKEDYDSKVILDSICKVLNNLRDFYNYEVSVNFFLKDQKPANFFIYDITDTLNNTSDASSVKFYEGHVYHFAPKDLYFSYSSILVLIKGKLVIFRGLNCKKKINRVEEVISFMENNLKNSNNLNETIERVRSYRRFGKYFKIDMDVCGCEE